MFDQLSVLYHYVKTKYRPPFRTRDQLLRWQEKQIRKHVHWVKNHSAFYRQYWGNRSPDDWQNLPIIDKSVMMEYFDLLNTVGIRKDEALAIAMKAEKTRDFQAKWNKVTVGLSSGTSGSRGLFLVSDEERRRWAGTVLAKTLPGSLLGQTHRVAFFLRADSQLYQTVKQQRISFQFFDLFADLSEHLSRLQAYQPTILVAPPSMLLLLAEAKEAGELSIKPRKIISVAEVLDPLDKTHLEKQFGQMIHQIYQCTEGFLAATCEHGTLHLNEDVVAIQKEYIDRKQKRFVPIITDFRRTSQPIVRYRLNDILTERKACPCGSVMTAIEQIEGRCDDIFYFPAATPGEYAAIFPDFIRRAVILSTEQIKEYQVVQHSTRQMEIRLSCTEGADRDALQKRIAKTLHILLSSKGITPPEITFGDRIEKPKGKKLKRVERRYRLGKEKHEQGVLH